MATALASAGVPIVPLHGTERFHGGGQHHRGPGYQVPLSAQTRGRSGVPTAAVGLIMDVAHAESLLLQGEADVITIGPQALYDPFWALHARQQLAADPSPSPSGVSKPAGG